MDYQDKRSRYRNASPAEFAAGTPKFDNPVKQRADVVYSRPAIRGERKPFRATTAPKPPEPEPVIEAPKPADAVPAEGQVSIDSDSIFQKREGYIDSEL